MNSSITTDNTEGNKIASQQDGLVAIQLWNNSRFNLYISIEKTQSFLDRSIIIPPNTLWPITGPAMWAGDLWCYTDAIATKVTIPMIKSLKLGSPKSNSLWPNS